MTPSDASPSPAIPQTAASVLAAAPALVGGRKTAKRVLVADAVAGGIVRTGGMLVIAAVIGILVFLVAAVLPLFRGARVAELPVAGAAPVVGRARALAIDEYRMLAMAVGDAPEVVYFRVDTGEATARVPVAGLEGGTVSALHRTVRTNELVVATTDGRVAFLTAGFASDFVLGEAAVPLRATMKPGDVRRLDDGVVRRVAGGHFLRVRPNAAVRGTLSLPAGAGAPSAAGYASHADGGAALVATASGLHVARETL